jgi:gliding motility-associated-like protein
MTNYTQRFKMYITERSSSIFRPFFLLLIAISIGVSILKAQPTFNVSSDMAAPGSVVAIDFSVNNFQNIVGMQFSINWDPTVLRFRSLINITNQLNDFDAGAFNTDSKFTNLGQAIVTWFDNSAEPNTVSNGAVLFTIEFDVVGGEGSTSDITISGTPRQIEVIDNNENNIGLTVNSGMFTATGGGGTGSVRLIGSDETAMNGEVACVKISVNGFTDVAGMQFSMNWDVSFLEFTGFQNFNLSGLNDGSFNLDNVAEGKIPMQWLDPSSAGITLPDGTVIFEMCFRVLGTTGSRSIRFTNDPLEIEVVDSDDNTKTFSKKDATITVMGSGGGGFDCDVTGFALGISEEETMNGQQVCTDVFVRDFTNITSLGGTVEWDPTVVSSPQVTDFNLSDLSVANFNLDQGANGVLSFVWFDESTNGITLQDDAVIFRICFNAIGANGTSTSVTFTDRLTEREASRNGVTIQFNQCDGQVQVGDGISPGSVSKTLTHPACNGDSNGAINIVITGGVPPYQVEWSQGGTVISNAEDLLNVTAGVYSLKVTDNVGTVFTEETIELIDPDMLAISNVQVQDAENGNDGSISITVSGGTSPYTYAWSNGASTQNLNNLMAGDYMVTVSDSRQCQVTSTSIGVGGGALSLTVTTSDFNGSGVSCPGECDGSAMANVSGGIRPYTYAWSSGPTTASITGLCEGQYQVTVTDADGAQMSATVTIVEPLPLSVSVETSPAQGINAGTAEAMVGGGTMPYSYRWSGTNQMTRFITNLSPGLYTVIVTDQNGCNIRGDGEVRDTDVECYTGRQVITPNNDGKNDELEIACAPAAENELEIFDRWGVRVFRQDNYDNSWRGMDGAGTELPDGGYFWVLRVTDPNGVEKLHKGHVTIVRKFN